jgi:hypothetical protein
MQKKVGRPTKYQPDIDPGKNIDSGKKRWHKSELQYIILFRSTNISWKGE